MGIQHCSSLTQCCCDASTHIFKSTYKCFQHLTAQCLLDTIMIGLPNSNKHNISMKRNNRIIPTADVKFFTQITLQYFKTIFPKQALNLVILPVGRNTGSSTAPTLLFISHFSIADVCHL